MVRVGAMGDVVHALPAVAALRQAQPQLRVGWVVDPRWAPLLANQNGTGPLVDTVHLADTQQWTRSPVSLPTLRSVLRLRRGLRAAAYPRVVDMQGTLRSAVLARFAGTGAIAGYADPRERPAAWAYTRHLVRRGNHVVDQGAALLGQALGLELTPAFAALPTETEAERWASKVEEAQPNRICVLSVGAGWPAKQWPAVRYAALAQRLRGKGYRVICNAAPGGDAAPAAVAGESQGAAEVVRCDVAGLLALLRRAALVVGGDSGPVHVAALLGVRVLALFGPTDPARNGPWGPGPKRVLRHPASVTSYRHVAAPDPGLLALEVDAVWEAVVDLLQEQPLARE